MRYLFVFLLLLGVHAQAQQLSGDYPVIGQMDTIYDGAETTFYIATIPAKAKSFAEIKVFFGQRVLVITGVSVAADGGYATPMLSFTIPLSRGNPGVTYSLNIKEAGQDTKHSTEAENIGGGVVISNFSLSDGGAVSFDFSAVATRLVADENWDQTPEEGRAQLPISGHVSLVVPPEFIADGT